MILILERIKSLLGITNRSQDEILKHILTGITEKVKRYCRIKAVSPALETVICDMAVDIYRARSYGQEEAEPIVSSIKEGERTVSFQTAGLKSESEIFGSYAADLRRYRKPGW